MTPQGSNIDCDEYDFDCFLKGDDDDDAVVHPLTLPTLPSWQLPTLQPPETGLDLPPPVYTCDDRSGNICIIQGVDDLNRWTFAAYDMQGVSPFNGIKFTSCHVDKLPAKVMVVNYRYPGSITTIDLSGIHIKMVEKFHFTVFNLLYVNLSRNEIENLDSSSIFGAHPKLQVLDLSLNRIGSIGSNAFDGLSELRVLKLNENQLKVITESVFAPLIRLIDLELCGNLIERFENTPFAQLVDLQMICLQQNNFSEFNFNLFERNPVFRAISLGNNNNGTDFISLIGNINFTGDDVHLSQVIQSNTTIIPSRSVSIKNSKLSELMIPTIAENIVATNSTIKMLLFDGNDSMLLRADFSRNLLAGQLSFEYCRKLEVLDLSFNQIEGVKFSNQSRLTNLNLSNNKLTLIHPTMANLINLKMLDLSFNCIENFEIHTFHTMTSLEVLNLRESCFKSLDYGTFSLQVNLKVLDISFNRLNNVDLELLSASAELQDLFIDGNNLTNIQSIDQIGNYFPNLRSIGLTHNDWNCKELSQLVNKIRRLNVNLFVEKSVSHKTNIRGIGCTTRNSTRETLIVMKDAVPINHTAYMNKIEKINEIVQTVNELNDTRNNRESLRNAFRDLQQEKSKLKSDFDKQIDQLKTFGKGIVQKFKTLIDDNSKALNKMKARLLELDETNNEKNELIVDRIKSLNDKLKSIQSDEENFSDNRIVAKYKTNRQSDYYGDLDSLKTLEIILIVSLFVLVTVALYYIYVYC